MVEQAQENRMDTLQLPPLVRIGDEDRELRLLEKLADIWTRMEREGITRLAEAGKDDLPANR